MHQEGESWRRERDGGGEREFFFFRVCYTYVMRDKSCCVCIIEFAFSASESGCVWMLYTLSDWGGRLPRAAGAIARDIAFRSGRPFAPELFEVVRRATGVFVCWRQSSTEGRNSPTALLLCLCVCVLRLPSNVNHFCLYYTWFLYNLL